jgi:hypothetical protein
LGTGAPDHLQTVDIWFPSPAGWGRVLQTVLVPSPINWYTLSISGGWCRLKRGRIIIISSLSHQLHKNSMVTLIIVYIIPSSSDLCALLLSPFPFSCGLQCTTHYLSVTRWKTFPSQTSTPWPLTPTNNLHRCHFIVNIATRTNTLLNPLQSCSTVYSQKAV